MSDVDSLQDENESIYQSEESGSLYATSSEESEYESDEETVTNTFEETVTNTFLNVFSVISN